MPTFPVARLLLAAGLIIGGLLLATQTPATADPDVTGDNSPVASPRFAEPGQPARPLQLAQADGPALNEKAAEAHREFLGMSSCRNCHNSKTVDVLEIENQADLTPLERAGQASGKIREDKWVRLDEYRIWNRQDKHNQSFTVLLNERSRLMARILGVVDEQGESLIHRDVRCLTCHSGVPHYGLPTEDVTLADSVKMTMVTEKFTKDPKLFFGVSCEGCHGPSGPGSPESGLKGWKDHHYTAETWRFMPAEKKLKEYGYFDVRSPVSKSRICLSCHLGNVEERKVVTHEMYAAGHPPLPGFELSTFISQEPMHWREFETKEVKIQDEFKRLAGANAYVSPKLNRTQDVLIGAIAGLAEYMKLNGDLCAKDVNSATDKSEWMDQPEWPELANFSCFACHHDLEDKGWRLLRTPVKTAGRPRLHEWPQALVEVALEVGAENAQAGKADIETFRQLLEAVNKDIDDAPFGQPASVKSSAGQLSKWLFTKARSMEKDTLDPTRAKRALELIAGHGATQALDYDATRNLAWAFAAIYDELHPTGISPEAQKDNYGILSVPGWYKERTGLDQIQLELQKFHPLEENSKPLLVLDLRAGRDGKVVSTIGNVKIPTKQVDLQTTYPIVGRHSPENVRNGFSKLLQLLTEKGSNSDSN